MRVFPKPPTLESSLRLPLELPPLDHSLVLGIETIHVTLNARDAYDLEPQIEGAVQGGIPLAGQLMPGIPAIDIIIIGPDDDETQPAQGYAEAAIYKTGIALVVGLPETHAELTGRILKSISGRIGEARWNAESESEKITNDPGQNLHHGLEAQIMRQVPELMLQQISNAAGMLAAKSFDAWLRANRNADYYHTLKNLVSIAFIGAGTLLSAGMHASTRPAFVPVALIGAGAVAIPSLVMARNTFIKYMEDEQSVKYRKTADSVGAKTSLGILAAYSKAKSARL